MHVTVTMSEQDHFLATLFVNEATPTFLNPTARDVLATATMSGPDRAYRIDADDEKLGELLWAMDRCVELIELDCSKAAANCCDSYDHDYNLRLDAAARRLEAEIDAVCSDIDYDGSDERDDDDLVDCGPEYPRNDAGEWLGRM